MKLHWQRVPRKPDWPLWAVGIVGMWLAIVAATAWWSHVRGREITLCWFKAVTGQPCPTCGATRSVLAMLSLHPLDALLWNPLALALLLVLTVSVLLRCAFGRAVRFELSSRERIWSVVALVGIVLANWAYVLWRGN